LNAEALPDPSELALRVRNTLAAKAYQNQIAYYDALTHLPNRSLFLDRLDWFLQRAERNDDNLVLLHITLGQFKRVYSTLGPEVGDQVIKQIAERISACVQPSDVVGGATDEKNKLSFLFRLGSDEFAVLCPNMAHTEHATSIASRILATMEDSFDAGGTRVQISPCIGIASYPSDASDMAALIQSAEGASAQVSAEEKGGFQFYSSDMNAKSRERLQMEADLRHAIDAEQLVLHYQPIVDVKNGQVTGVEALVRWQKSDGKFIFSNEFIPVAEETGLIHEIGEWVLIEACRTMSEMAADRQLRVAVNLSPKQFSRPGRLLECILYALRESGLMPNQLELEITETILIDDRPEIADLIDQLDRIGVRLSIDDFGTGYSALNYLQRFPFDVLKIDRSFTSQVPDSGANASLIRAIIAMAHALDLEVIAEGIERREQAGFLLVYHCEFGQGHLYSRPMTADALRLHLADPQAIPA